MVNEEGKVPLLTEPADRGKWMHRADSCIVTCWD